MALFASKEASTLPWHAGQVVDVYRVEVDGKPASGVTRKYVQHNEPNPILVAFREYSDKHGMDTWELATFAGAWLRVPANYERHLVAGRVRNNQRDHARRVLTRLASLAD